MNKASLRTKVVWSPRLRYLGFAIRKLAVTVSRNLL